MGLPVRWRYRRISGILFPLRGDCHFSRPAVARRLKRPTLRRRTSSPFEAEASLSLYLDLQPIRFTPAECRHPPRELLPRVFTLTNVMVTLAVYFSVALSVTLACTFLLRSMVLCAVPTFLAPALPARDSLPESRCKDTDFLFISLSPHRQTPQTHLSFPIGNPQQIHSFLPSTHIDIIRALQGRHPLSQSIIHLYFGECYAFNMKHF